MTEDVLDTRNYTIELTADEGQRFLAALRQNDSAGDQRALAAVTEAVQGGRMFAIPAVFKPVRASEYAEVVRVDELSC